MELVLGSCTLRDWRRTDRDALCRHANNLAIARNLRDGFPHPYTAAHADWWLAMCEKRSPQTFFAIAIADEAVGGIGLTLHDDVERVAAELGYWLSEAHWGKGVVTAAVRADRVGVCQLPPHSRLRDALCLKPRLSARAGESRLHAGGPAAPQHHQARGGAGSAHVRARALSAAALATGAALRT